VIEIFIYIRKLLCNLQIDVIVAEVIEHASSMADKMRNAHYQNDRTIYLYNRSNQLVGSREGVKNNYEQARG
jgi:hypothetical protein